MVTVAVPDLGEDPIRQKIDELAINRDEFAQDEELRSKLVLHRGWHRLQKDDTSRPLENTRQAYLDAARMGVTFAECDVWMTKDGVVVLSHDNDFKWGAARGEDELACLPISDLTWDALCDIELVDGSTPVKLETVLEDLKATSTKLVVEIKCSSLAAYLGTFVAERRDLASAIGWVMSFSFSAIEQFSDAGGRESGVRTMWLLDNAPYAEKHVGETTFDYSAEDLPQFFQKLDITKRVQRIQCGLYIQYRASLTSSVFSKLRNELIDVLKEESESLAPSLLLGLWSDIGLDAEFDHVENLLEWISKADAVNTDLPSSFWMRSQGTACAH